MLVMVVIEETDFGFFLGSVVGVVFVRNKAMRDGIVVRNRDKLQLYRFWVLKTQ